MTKKIQVGHSYIEEHTESGATTIGNESSCIVLPKDSGVIKMTYDALCEICDWEGSITYEGNAIAKVTFKKMNINDQNGPAKCPKCSNNIYIPEGTYVLNRETGKMEKFSNN